MAPFFSICVPVYNPGEKLKGCLDSILQQTCGDFELLCCDDKSTDGSLAVLREYAARDSRVKVLENAENCGSLTTRNRLFRQASGQYSVWADNDDYFSLDCFETAYRILSETPCDILEFPYEMIYEDGRRIFVQRTRLFVETDHLSRFFLQRHRPHNWYLWSKFFRTEIMQKSIPPDFRVCLDDVFYGIPLFHYSQSYRWAAVDHPMYHYGASNGVWSSFQQVFSLQKLHSLCEMRAKEVAYNVDFFFREKLATDLLAPILDSCDLHDLLHLIAEFPQDRQREALEVFFRYFCRGNTLINDRPDLPIAAEPVLKRMEEEMPWFNRSLIRSRMPQITIPVP